VAQIIYAQAAFDDLLRIEQVLAADDPTLAANTLGLIRSAINALAERPQLGRGAEDGLRELAISRGRTGYVALYRHLEFDDTALILAVRHRREAGYQV
jgi:plasmid stabilization system protein ParE